MVKLLFLITNELCLTILKCSLKVWNLFCTFRFKATSTLKPTVRGSAWFTEGSQSDYGRKTVLKFAVNAKQISTPLNGWINSTREQAHREAEGRRRDAVGKSGGTQEQEKLFPVKGNCDLCVFNWFAWNCIWHCDLAAIEKLPVGVSSATSSHTPSSLPSLALGC